METENIRLFVKISEMNSIREAGRALGFSPSIASARLVKLEKEVGSDLVYRTTRKVSLSSEGEQFLPYAKEILAQQDNALEEINNKEENLSGVLRFATSSSFAQLYIIPILGQFIEKYPNIRLDLRLSDLPVDVFESGIDIALRNIAVEDCRLRARKLTLDKRILCATPQYLHQYGKPENEADLTQHSLIVFRHSQGRNLVTATGETMARFPPSNIQPRLVVDDGTSMRLATLAHLGISMNSIWSVRKELDSGALVRVLPELEVDDQTALWVVYPHSNLVSHKVRIMIDFLVSQLSDGSY